MITDYTLVFAKTIKISDVVNFNKMSIFLKRFFGLEIKSKISKKNNNIENNNKENNNIENNNIENNNIENNNIENNNIENKLNEYGIPSNIQSGLLNYDENLNEENLKIKMTEYIITSTLLENFNKYFEKKCEDIIMIIKTVDYENIVDNIYKTKDNNVLKLPKIDNFNNIIGLNNVLTFKIDEKIFNLNKSNVLKQLLSLLEQNKLICVKK